MATGVQKTPERQGKEAEDAGILKRMISRVRCLQRGGECLRGPYCSRVTEMPLYLTRVVGSERGGSRSRPCCSAACGCCHSRFVRSLSRLLAHSGLLEERNSDDPCRIATSRGCTVPSPLCMQRLQPPHARSAAARWATGLSCTLGRSAVFPSCVAIASAAQGASVTSGAGPTGGPQVAPTRAAR